MKRNTNKLAMYTALGLMFGAGIGIVLNIIVNKSSFGFGIPIGAGIGMLVGIVVGSILSNRK